jgi:hypothetical protein
VSVSCFLQAIGVAFRAKADFLALRCLDIAIIVASLAPLMVAAAATASATVGAQAQPRPPAEIQPPASSSGNVHGIDDHNAFGELQERITTLEARIHISDSLARAQDAKVWKLKLEYLRVDRLLLEERETNRTAAAQAQMEVKQMERERDFYRDGVEEFRDRMDDSMKVNEYLTRSLHALIGGVYPDCDIQRLFNPDMQAELEALAAQSYLARSVTVTRGGSASNDTTDPPDYFDGRSPQSTTEPLVGGLPPRSLSPMRSYS